LFVGFRLTKDNHIRRHFSVGVKATDLSFFDSVRAQQADSELYFDLLNKRITKFFGVASGLASQRHGSKWQKKLKEQFFGNLM